MVFTNKTSTLVSKSFVAKMRLKFPTTICSFKINPVLLYNYFEDKYMSSMVFSNTEHNI